MTSRIVIEPGGPARPPWAWAGCGARGGPELVARRRHDRRRKSADYPELEPDDFRAVYEFAARMGRRVAL